MNVDMIVPLILQKYCIARSQPGVHQRLHSRDWSFIAAKQYSGQQRGDAFEFPDAERKGLQQNNCRYRLQYDFGLARVR